MPSNYDSLCLSVVCNDVSIQNYPNGIFRMLFLNNSVYTLTRIRGPT